MLSLKPFIARAWRILSIACFFIVFYSTVQGAIYLAANIALPPSFPLWLVLLAFVALGCSPAIQKKLAERGALVPGQVMPEPVIIASWEEKQELVGQRPLSEVATLIQEGIALSLQDGEIEYSIVGGLTGTFDFEVWVRSSRSSCQSYPCLDALLQAEHSRPSFVLSEFVLIG